MSSLFKGLDAFGIEDIDKNDLFEEKAAAVNAAEEKAVIINEEDQLYDRTVRCPVCNTVSEVRTVKQGVSQLDGTGINLRPKYSTVDLIRYDVILCEVCGYAALNRNFKKVSERQIKLIQEKISMKYVGIKYPKVYDYKVALERYKMALYNDMVMGRSDVNMAYLCLKASWTIESIIKTCNDEKDLTEYQEMHKDFVTNAFKGFSKSYNEASFPVFGMNQPTYQYLLAILAYEIGDIKATGYWLGKVMLSPISSSRIKEKARELKARIDADKE